MIYSKFFFINNFIYFVFFFILLENTKEEEGEKLLPVNFFFLIYGEVKILESFEKVLKCVLHNYSDSQMST